MGNAVGMDSLLPRQAWHEFFELVTKEHEASDVTIEVAGLDLGDQVEVEKLPLAYVEYDPKDDDFVVGVGGRDNRYPVVLDHIVSRPERIEVDTEIPTASSTTRRVIRPGYGTHFVNAWISASRSAPLRAANRRRKSPMKSSAGP